MALYRRVVHPRQHNAPPNTPLATVFENGHTRMLWGDYITASFYAIIRAIGPGLFFSKTDVSV